MTETTETHETAVSPLAPESRAMQEAVVTVLENLFPGCKLLLLVHEPSNDAAKPASGAMFGNVDAQDGMGMCMSVFHALRAALEETGDEAEPAPEPVLQ